MTKNTSNGLRIEPNKNQWTPDNCVNHAGSSKNKKLTENTKKYKNNQNALRGTTVESGTGSRSDWYQTVASIVNLVLELCWS